MNRSINCNGFIDPYHAEGAAKTTSERSITSNLYNRTDHYLATPYDPAADLQALREVVKRAREK